MSSTAKEKMEKMPKGFIDSALLGRLKAYLARLAPLSVKKIDALVPFSDSSVGRNSIIGH